MQFFATWSAGGKKETNSKWEETSPDLEKSFFETLGQFKAAFHGKLGVKREMTRERSHFLLHDIQLKLAKARFDLHVYTRLITRGICCWNATENWTLSPKFPFFSFLFPISNRKEIAGNNVMPPVSTVQNLVKNINRLLVVSNCKPLLSLRRERDVYTIVVRR